MFILIFFVMVDGGFNFASTRIVSIYESLFFESFFNRKHIRQQKVTKFRPQLFAINRTMMTMSNEKLEQSPGERLFEVLCSPPRLMVKSLLKRSYALREVNRKGGNWKKSQGSMARNASVSHKTFVRLTYSSY